MIGDADEDHPLYGQALSGCGLGLGKGFAEVVGHAHDFAGGFHLRTEHSVHAGKFVPGEDRRFHVVGRSSIEILLLFDELRHKFAQLAASHQASSDLCHWNASSF